MQYTAYVFIVRGSCKNRPFANSRLDSKFLRFFTLRWIYFPLMRAKGITFHAKFNKFCILLAKLKCSTRRVNSLIPIVAILFKPFGLFAAKSV
jgi:hypothetical protein